MSRATISRFVNSFPWPGGRSVKNGQTWANLTEKVSFGKSGPSAKDYKSFADNNRAAAFGRDGDKGAVIRVEDIGPGSQFDFDNGDPITIEAWVNPEKELQSGATMYILGKGRTGNRGQQPHNQNYGFRVFRSGDSVLLSFLFRSQTVGAHKSDWHRWDSVEGFQDWFRVASRRGDLRLRQTGEHSRIR